MLGTSINHLTVKDMLLNRKFINNKYNSHKTRHSRRYCSNERTYNMTRTSCGMKCAALVSCVIIYYEYKNMTDTIQTKNNNYNIRSKLNLIEYYKELPENVRDELSNIMIVNGNTSVETKRYNYVQYEKNWPDSRLVHNNDCVEQIIALSEKYILNHQLVIASNILETVAHNHKIAYFDEFLSNTHQRIVREKLLEIYVRTRNDVRLLSVLKSYIVSETRIVVDIIQKYYVSGTKPKSDLYEYLDGVVNEQIWNYYTCLDYTYLSGIMFMLDKKYDKALVKFEAHSNIIKNSPSNKLCYTKIFTKADHLFLVWALNNLSSLVQQEEERLRVNKMLKYHIEVLGKETIKTT